MQEQDIIKLTDEYIYHRYLMNKDQMKKYFQELRIPEYIALQSIARSEPDGDSSGKVYLRDLAEKMQISIQQASKMAGEMQDRGLLTWTHDGNGSEGTYVTITPIGAKMMRKQQEAFRAYFGKVIEKFGVDNLEELFRLMYKLERVMKEELQLMAE